MASRFAAALGALILFVLIAVLSVPVLIGVREPAIPSADPARPVATLEQPTSAGLLEAELFLLPGLGYRLDLLVSLDPGAPPPRILRPTVILEMEEMGGGRTEPPLHLIGMGEFSASGTFPMSGRWRFRVGFEDELFDLPVRVPEAPPPIPAPALDPARSSFGQLAEHSDGDWL